MPTITINFDYFLQLGSLPLPLMLARLFLDGGWIFILVIFVQFGWIMWVQSRQVKFNKGVRYILLAIDVPKENEQTPKAVEQIFSQLAGAYSGADNYEKYWIGKTQSVFSFELVSVDGYVQFLVHTPAKFRDLIEAAVYAQYPDAEIIEVEDYADKVPLKYPDDEWDCWGTEFALKKPAAFPIRTHLQFEHNLSEEYFKDPLGPMLEIFSSMKKGEQLWLQYIIMPCDDSWKDASAAIADKILGRKKPAPKTLADDLVAWPLAVVNEVAGLGGSAPSEKKDATPKMLQLSPGERNVLETIQLKAAKHGFLTKIRMVYVAKKTIANRGKVVSPMKGAFGQFAALDSNAIKVYGKVAPKGDYFWEKWSVPEKTNNIIRNYKNRSGRGGNFFVLNVEELATLYHFPYKTVKAPLIKRTEAKRAEPPSHLPTADIDAIRPFKRKKAAPPPSHLPAPPPEPEDAEGDAGDDGDDLLKI
ncbi:MAG: hypothetical protein WCT10_01440 [Patescibacteria group bacterium]|jgi:hypothetical protein